MLLRDLLAETVLISNTHNLFDYNTFKQRFLTRYAKRVVRDDYTAAELADIAQNTLDINLQFLKGLSAQTIDPFKTWNETDDFTAGTERTEITTPDLTDTTTPNLTETTTPNLQDKTDYTGTIQNESTGDGSNANYVNAYDGATISNPLDNGTTHSEGNQTTTYNNGNTVEHTGNTTTKQTGTSTVQHSGTTETKISDSSADNRVRWGWKIDDYKMAMELYRDFIDVVIDLMVQDILLIVVRG